MELDIAQSGKVVHGDHVVTTFHYSTRFCDTSVVHAHTGRDLRPRPAHCVNGYLVHVVRVPNAVGLRS